MKDQNGEIGKDDEIPENTLLLKSYYRRFAPSITHHSLVLLVPPLRCRQPASQQEEEETPLLYMSSS